MKSRAQLVWNSLKFPRKYVNAEGKKLPLSMQVYAPGSFEIIARAVCRRELNEARERVVVERGKYFFQPSINYIRARLGFRPKNNITNGNEYKNIAICPFRENS